MPVKDLVIFCPGTHGVGLKEGYFFAQEMGMKQSLSPQFDQQASWISPGWIPHLGLALLLPIIKIKIITPFASCWVLYKITLSFNLNDKPTDKHRHISPILEGTEFQRGEVTWWRSHSQVNGWVGIWTLACLNTRSGYSTTNQFISCTSKPGICSIRL